MTVRQLWMYVLGRAKKFQGRHIRPSNRKCEPKQGNVQGYPLP